MTEFGIRNMDQVAPVYNGHRGMLKRQFAFDNVSVPTSLYSGLFSAYEEEQAVPTGLDSYSHDSSSCELPLLTPCSKAVMSQALKDTFNGFTKERCRLGIPGNPWLWDENHVFQWLLWAAKEFSLENVNFQKFLMNGHELCSLGKERFLALAPDFVGDILWEHLEEMMKEHQVKAQESYIDHSNRDSVNQWMNADSLNFPADPLQCGAQVHNYPKNGMFNDMCSVPTGQPLLTPKQEFQQYPSSCLKSRAVNYPPSQDFARSNMNALLSSLNSGKLFSMPCISHSDILSRNI
ncbi:hypothetical protein XENTR_v10004834 [Xenopus tropicalis]|nr:hypothetical protein XENTR_v10004834 [Xenopus tropicalis]